MDRAPARFFLSYKTRNDMTVQLLHGDCRELLKALQDCSVDSVVTDPPYELGFMGNGWDRSGVANDVAVWAECLRVLKPGGHLLSFGGSRTQHRMVCAVEDAGFEIRDQIMWIYGGGSPKGKNSLKPAQEPICMARKRGSGMLNIENCRVEPTGESQERVDEPSQDRRYTENGGTSFAAKPGVRGGNPLGRWPANVIHDGSDEVLAAFPDAPGQLAKAAEGGDRRKDQNCYSAMLRGSNGTEPREDSNKSSARFFYCARASKKDRGEGNVHPTVKPTDLMRYLVRLVTPSGGVVLDPFMGSGSTGKAAALEGFDFIGIDMTQAYFEIARKRIEEIA
jgi:DNA modification methylase